MAGLLGMGMPRPRGRGMYEDTLLGIEPEVGMTDSSFQQMGRAPVDELWAGRNSAAIDDREFAEIVKKAGSVVEDAIASGVDYEAGEYNPDSIWGVKPDRKKLNEGGLLDRHVRDAVARETGMHIYPGNVVGPSAKDSGDMTFMTEFSDQGASMKEGWRDSGATTLGEVLDHDELYKHYPEISSLPFSMEAMESNQLGRYGGQTYDNPAGLLAINSNLDDNDALSTIIHEAQHYIQNLEGWGGGGGVTKNSVINFEDVRDEYTTDRVMGMPSITREPERYERERDNYEYEAYSNIDGEILARDAVSRMNYPRWLMESVEVDSGLSGQQKYPVRESGFGNNQPHEMKRGLLDEIVQEGMLLNAIQKRMSAGVDGKYANPRTKRESFLRLEGNL